MVTFLAGNHLILGFSCHPDRFILRVACEFGLTESLRVSLILEFNDLNRTLLLW